MCLGTLDCSARLASTPAGLRRQTIYPAAFHDQGDVPRRSAGLHLYRAAANRATIRHDRRLDGGPGRLPPAQGAVRCRCGLRRRGLGLGRVPVGGPGWGAARVVRRHAAGSVPAVQREPLPWPGTADLFLTPESYPRYREALHAFRPTALHVYPSAGHIFATLVVEAGDEGRFPGVRSIFTASENLYPWQVQSLRQGISGCPHPRPVLECREGRIHVPGASTRTCILASPQ